MLSLYAISRGGQNWLLVATLVSSIVVLSFPTTGAEQAGWKAQDQTAAPQNGALQNPESGNPESSNPEIENPASGYSDTEAEEIARQVLKLQEQLGGSIIQTSQSLEETPGLLQPSQASGVPLPSPPHTKYKRGAKKQLALAHHRINSLRNAAWQLDSTAHQLEQLDQYPQADALRELAHRLRHDARGQKQALGTP